MTYRGVLLLWLVAAAIVAGAAYLANASPASDARQAARGVMDTYRKAHPDCDWCGATGSLVNRIEVHHIIPVSVATDTASDIGNMITLCRRCHIVIGHCGDNHMRRYCPNLRAVLALREVRP